jgi:hypothetical protein
VTPGRDKVTAFWWPAFCERSEMKKSSSKETTSAVQVQIITDRKQSIQESESDFYNAPKDLLCEAKWACAQMHAKVELDRTGPRRDLSGGCDEEERALLTAARLKAGLDLGSKRSRANARRRPF